MPPSTPPHPTLVAHRPFDWAVAAFALLGGGGIGGVGLWLWSAGRPGWLVPLGIGVAVFASALVMARGAELVLGEDIALWLGWRRRRWPWSDVETFEQHPRPDRFSDGTVKQMQWVYVARMRGGERLEFRSTWENGAAAAEHIRSAIAGR